MGSGGWSLYASAGARATQRAGGGAWKDRQNARSDGYWGGALKMEDMMGVMGLPFGGGAHLTAVELLWD